jgi:dolichol-phosphate mannosyltransferase
LASQADFSGPGSGAGQTGAAPEAAVRDRIRQADAGDRLAAASGGHRAPRLSIVVTTSRAESVELLVRRLEGVVDRLPLVYLPLEIILAPTGDTALAISEISSALEVRLVHRTPAERAGGLGGAVVAGMRVARAPWVCVMDADLQHPPEVIEKLLRRALEPAVDLVVASRFCEGGEAGEGLSPIRMALSRLCSSTAALLFPRRLRGVSDPLSGFFLVRREALSLKRLRPTGFKILLEILVRTPALSVKEVPFSFGERNAGQTKASAGEAARYLSHLWKLRLGEVPRRFGRFGAVGATGLAVNMVLLAALADLVGLYYLAAAILATQGSTLWNFALTELWVFPDRDHRRQPLARLGLFLAVNNAALVLRVPLLFVLTSALGVHYLVSNLISLLSLTLARYALADVWIWARAKRPEGEGFAYDIHGIVSVESEVRLPELERFRVAELVEEPGVRVRIGALQEPNGSGSSRRIRYVEGSSVAGFGVEIAERDGRIEVTASPLLRHSPHVLYTNVVEPILRWTFARKGFALVHAACFAAGERAFMVTARSDRGKTATTLKILDRHPYSFVSDDVTILCPDGRVLAYPKPLTVDRRTVKSVRRPPLTRRERLALSLRSRRHRVGRRAAMLGVKLRLPAATVAAITQRLAPAPEYHIEELIPSAQIVPEAQLSEIVVLDRRGANGEQLGRDEALDVLLEHGSDADGLGLRSQIASLLQSADGQDLEARERDVVARALDRIPATFLRRERVAGEELAEPDVSGVAPTPQARLPLRGRLLATISRNRDVLLLLAIMLIAALPRLWAIGSVGFRGDEAVYAGQAAVIAGDDDAGRYFILTSRGNSNFLLYQYLLSFVYLIFGVGDVAARLVASTFSILTVLVVFELGRTLYGKTVGFLGAGLLALSSYSVLLGRLALLDSTLTFFFTLAVLCIAKWVMTERRVWLYCFAAATALAIQAKVVGALVILIAALYLLMSRHVTRLWVRGALISSLVFLFYFTPVFLQLAHNSAQFVDLLSDSSGRTTKVPWHYYADKLFGYEGILIPALWIGGLAVAIKQRLLGDRLLLIWVVVFATFFQIYPLKAFNYLLPLIPPLSLLGGRAIYVAARRFGPWLFSARSRSGFRRLAPVGLLLLIALASFFPLRNVIRTDTYVGLKQAALWLRSHTPQNAGVITPSKGSAQYALAWYADRDSYPFGRFRLATVLPGGRVLRPRPASEGPSKDWVSLWPPRLVQNREVSYLVYYTEEGDDPPEDPLVESQTQKLFRNFVEAYGGRLVHAVYRNHEARALIYKVTKLLPQPRITFASGAGVVRLSGEGFRMRSPVTVYYHRSRLGRYPTDRNGSFSVRFPAPAQTHPRYWLVAVDRSGNYASSTGLGGRLPADSDAPRSSRKSGTSSGKPPRRSLRLRVEMPKAVPVGGEFGISVGVEKLTTGRGPVSEARLFFQVFSREGETVRWRERETNTLGRAQLNLAALELPGQYVVRIHAAKGRERGTVTLPLKVRRR